MAHVTYEDALKRATECHKGQKRKYSGEPYIIHPIAVASKFKDETHKIVAVLHDVVEDTHITMRDLKQLGYPMSVLDVLSLLTHRDKQTYTEYILHINTNLTARNVKREDIKHNLSDLKPGHQRDKYELALHILSD